MSGGILKPGWGRGTPLLTILLSGGIKSWVKGGAEVITDHYYVQLHKGNKSKRKGGGGGINSVTKQKVRSRVDCMEKLKQYFVTEILGLGGTVGVCI